MSSAPLVGCVWLLAWMGPAAAPVSRPAAPPPPPSDVGGSAGPRAPRSAETPPPTPPAARAEPAADAPQPEQPPADLSRTWSFARGAATTEPRYVQRATTPTSSAVHPIGFYSGVSSQGNNKPPARVATRPQSPGVLVTWTGFERTKQGTQVFIQLSGEASYEVASTGKTITVRIQNAKASTRNHLRPLDLRFFPTPVQTVHLKHDGSDTVATVALKQEVEPQVEVIAGSDGYRLLVLRFPATP